MFTIPNQAFQTIGFLEQVKSFESGINNDFVCNDLFKTSFIYIFIAAPECPKVDCGFPVETPGAEYGRFTETSYQSSFFFGCQETFKLAGQSSRNDNIVRCQSDGVWDFGNLRCEGPVCEDPLRPPDGIQISQTYEQGGEVMFDCTRPGYIPINPYPVTWYELMIIN